MKTLTTITLTIIFCFSFIFASEQNPTEEEVSKLYVATFNRAPDSEGLYYWTNDSNLTLSQIAQSFFDQTETKEKYPDGTSNRDFIRLIYNNLFNRNPDIGGWDYWEKELNSNRVTRNRFIEAIINGATDSDAGYDATVLNNKNDVGLYFANSGLSDIEIAKNIMLDISSSLIQVDAAKQYIDSLTTNNKFQYIVTLIDNEDTPASILLEGVHYSDITKNFSITLAFDYNNLEANSFKSFTFRTYNDNEWLYIEFEDGYPSFSIDNNSNVFTYSGFNQDGFIINTLDDNLNIQSSESLEEFFLDNDYFLQIDGKGINIARVNKRNTIKSVYKLYSKGITSLTWGDFFGVMDDTIVVAGCFVGGPVSLTLCGIGATASVIGDAVSIYKEDAGSDSPAADTIKTTTSILSGASGVEGCFSSLQGFVVNAPTRFNLLKNTTSMLINCTYSAKSVLAPVVDINELASDSITKDMQLGTILNQYVSTPPSSKVEGISVLNKTKSDTNEFDFTGTWTGISSSNTLTTSVVSFETGESETDTLYPSGGILKGQFSLNGGYINFYESTGQLRTFIGEYDNGDSFELESVFQTEIYDVTVESNYETYSFTIIDNNTLQLRTNAELSYTYQGIFMQIINSTSVVTLTRD